MGSEVDEGEGGGDEEVVFDEDDDEPSTAAIDPPKRASVLSKLFDLLKFFFPSSLAVAVAVVCVSAFLRALPLLVLLTSASSSDVSTKASGSIVATGTPVPLSESVGGDPCLRGEEEDDEVEEADDDDDDVDEEGVVVRLSLVSLLFLFSRNESEELVGDENGEVDGDVDVDVEVEVDGGGNMVEPLEGGIESEV